MTTYNNIPITQETLCILIENLGESWPERIKFYNPNSRPKRSTVTMVKDARVITFMRALSGCRDVDFKRKNVDPKLWIKVVDMSPTDQRVQNWWKNCVNRTQMLRSIEA